MRPLHESDYPVIDTDPIFSRVVRYMRPLDYTVWAATAASGPAFIYWLDKYHYTGGKSQLGRAMKIVGAFSTIGGFLTAYQMSSARFFGISENAREIRKYRQEYLKLKAEGKPMHGKSTLPLSIQRISSSYSTGAFLNFDVIPIFNFINHPFHSHSKGVIPDEDEDDDE
ncbi:hypothetical protein H4R24_004641 [Coemansia sp. RSA 988]|nr:hypothetical protein H4R24_004641 [Coemansia sp. RSA 988]